RSIPSVSTTSARRFARCSSKTSRWSPPASEILACRRTVAKRSSCAASITTSLSPRISIRVCFARSSRRPAGVDRLPTHLVVAAVEAFGRAREPRRSRHPPEHPHRRSHQRRIRAGEVDRPLVGEKLLRAVPEEGELTACVDTRPFRHHPTGVGNLHFG